MRLIDPQTKEPIIAILDEGVSYNGEHPYIKDLVTSERHPITCNMNELNWKVWVVEDSRLWQLYKYLLICKEPVTFQNRGQQPFFLYLGCSAKITFSSLSYPPTESNLELIEIVEEKKVEYQRFLRQVKSGQIRKNVV